MYRNFLLFALAITVVFLTSNCSGQSTSDTTALQPVTSTAGNEVEFSDLGLNFPPPSEMAARVTSINEDWLKPGCNYEEELPFANVAIEDASLLYRVVSESEPGTYQTSHAFYAFNIINHPMFTELKLIWHDYPGHLPCWVGLPIIETDEWDWIPLPANCRLYLNDISQYMSEEAPLTVGVVLAGRENQLLDFIRLGKNTEPSAHLSATPDTGAPPLEVTLDASESTDSDGNIVRYDWDFNGDGITDSRSYTQSWCKFTYRFPGSYNATVKVFDDSGDFGSANTTVSISDGSNLLPEAILTADPLSGDPPLTVEFDASGSTDRDGEIVRYDWDFDGNGTVDFRSYASPLAEHEYTSEGKFDARVWVTDNAGAQDSASVTINTQPFVNQPPVARVSADPVSGGTPLSVQFNAAASTDDDGEIVRFDWDFDGDGVVDFSDEESPFATHEYIQLGTYNAHLTVVDNYGAEGSTTVLIEVTDEVNLPPEAHLSADTFGGDIPLVVNFDASASRDEDGEIVRYRWDFDGDGNFDTSGSSPYTSHTYTSKGGYSVNLQVVDDRGAVDSTSAYIQAGSWTHTWGTDKFDYANDYVCDPQGNVYVCGGSGMTTGLESDGSEDTLLCKFSATGGLQWVRSWDTGNDDVLKSIAIDSQGDIWTCGFTYGYNLFSRERMTFDFFGWTEFFYSKSSDILLLKYSSSGELLLEKSISLPSFDIADSVVIDDNDNLYLVGYSSSFTAYSTSTEIIIAKFDPDGVLEWTKICSVKPGNKHEEIFAAAIGADGLLTISGTIVAGTPMRPFLIKVDLDGSLVWCKAYSLSGDDAVGRGFTFDSNGNIYFAGSFDDLHDLQPSYWARLFIQKLDPSGNPVWARSWGGTREGTVQEDLGYSCSMIGDNQLLVSGHTFFWPNCNSALLSLTPDGHFNWVKIRGSTKVQCYLRSKPGMPLYFIGNAQSSDLDDWCPPYVTEFYTFKSFAVDVADIELETTSHELTANDINGTSFVPNGVLDNGAGQRDLLISTY